MTSRSVIDVDTGIAQGTDDSPPNSAREVFRPRETDDRRTDRHVTPVIACCEAAGSTGPQAAAHDKTAIRVSGAERS